jgi:organic hydroperoxide reductase OsmC/OhrA
VHHVAIKGEGMATPFPHRYDVALAWDGLGGATLTAPPRPVIEGGAPPEFDGKDTWWSPEHLLLSSLSLCLMTTFRAIAGRARLEVQHYESAAEGVLDRSPAGLGFTRLALRVEIRVASAEQVDRARELLLKAKAHCIIGNALKPPIDLDVSVTAGSEAAVAVR